MSLKQRDAFLYFGGGDSNGDAFLLRKRNEERVPF